MQSRRGHLVPGNKKPGRRSRSGLREGFFVCVVQLVAASVAGVLPM
jgi:hypothetical protein